MHILNRNEVASFINAHRREGMIWSKYSTPLSCNLLAGAVFYTVQVTDNYFVLCVFSAFALQRDKSCVFNIEI